MPSQTSRARTPGEAAPPDALAGDARRVGDLPAAGLAVARRQPGRELPDLGGTAARRPHADLVLLRLDPVRAGDTAAVGVEVDHAELRDQGEQVECGLADPVAALLARGVVGNLLGERAEVRAQLAALVQVQQVLAEVVRPLADEPQSSSSTSRIS